MYFRLTMKTKRIFISILLVIALCSSNIMHVFAYTKSELDKKVQDTASFMLNKVSSPTLGEVGGDWVVIALSQSGVEVPDSYYEKYYMSVVEKVKACNGILHAKKYTDYSRTVLALTSIGKDPTNVGGYDILYPLGDFEKTVWQGLNGPVWALIALDSGNYEMPINTEANVQATRELYIDEILSKQLYDGGWAYGAKDKNTSSDPDMTAMAIQALAKYVSTPKVKTAINKALDCLSGLQDEKGGFASWGTTNAESCSQVIVALAALAVDYSDSRFVKNGYTLIDNLLSFSVSGGGFAHVMESSAGYVGGEQNQLASEQAFYALVAAKRLVEGKSFLYNLTEHFDWTKVHSVEKQEEKIPDDKPTEVVPDNKKAEFLQKEETADTNTPAPLENIDDKKETLITVGEDTSVNDERNIFIYIISCIVLIVVLVFVLLIMKRKKK